jgi:hypothetical protein
MEKIKKLSSRPGKIFHIIFLSVLLILETLWGFGVIPSITDKPIFDGAILFIISSVFSGAISLVIYVRTMRRVTIPSSVALVGKPADDERENKNDVPTERILHTEQE